MHGTVPSRPMTDRRSGGRGGDPQGDGGFDWLYSSSQQPPPPPEDSESTRVMPAYDPQAGRPDTDPPPRRIAPTPPGTPPPGSTRPRTGGRRPRFRLRWLLYLLIAWLVFLIGVPIYAWTTVSNVDADPGGKRPDDQPGTTYLVVGSDARKGLSGRRTDTIMMLHTGRGPNVLVSIPRDSLVEVPGHGTTKINAAFAFGGPKLLVETVEGATGVRIDHYVETGFNGLIKLVDAVGGIEICPETAMNDPLAQLKIPKGCQEADGKTALGYARSRKTQSLGDIDRARHQREVVSAIGAEVVSWKTIVNPVRYWRVMTSGADSVKVGDGTGPFAAGKFAFAMTRVDGESGLTCGVPIADLAVTWDAERAEQLFRLIAEDQADEIGKDLCTPTGQPK